MTYSKLKKGLTGALVLGGLCALIPATQDAAAQAIGVRTLEDMLTPTEAKIERGEKIYAQNCAQCHGDEGRGNAPYGQQLDPPAGSLVDTEWKYGGGPIAVYESITKKDVVPNHPVFNYLAYQDRWAVTHYVRSLGPTEPLEDTPEAIKRARFEAKNGICKEDIKQTISSQVEFRGEEQLEKGAELYAAQCASCHGDNGKGDGPAAVALNPKPRNFQAPDANWKKEYGPSPLGIFNVLSNGIDGSSMAAYPNLSADEKYSLAHYILREWVPDEVEEPVDEGAINTACRALSTPPKPPSIPIADAMRFLVEDQPEERRLEYARYGAAYVSPTASAENGQGIYLTYCADCHGVGGSGLGPGDEGADELGPYGSFPPYLYLSVNRLIPAKAGGTAEEFARRSMAGPHATLPGMTAASTLTDTQWKDLHKWVTTFDGEGEVVVGDPPPAPDEATIGPGGDIIVPEGAETGSEAGEEPGAAASGEQEKVAKPAQPASNGSAPTGSESASEGKNETTDEQ